MSDRPRYYATHRMFTGVPCSRGYVYDRHTGRVVLACPHRHRYPGGAARAQACAERMLRAWLRDGPTTTT